MCVHVCALFLQAKPFPHWPGLTAFSLTLYKYLRIGEKDQNIHNRVVVSGDVIYMVVKRVLCVLHSPNKIFNW